MPNAEHELDRHGSNGQSEMPRELYDPDDPEGDPDKAVLRKGTRCPLTSKKK